MFGPYSPGYGKVMGDIDNFSLVLSCHFVNLTPNQQQTCMFLCWPETFKGILPWRLKSSYHTG